MGENLIHLHSYSLLYTRQTLLSPFIITQFILFYLDNIYYIYIFLNQQNF